MNRILFLIIASYLTMNIIYAQTGTTGLTFLKLGVGGRAIGMGEAFSAVSNDASATYYNPAMLPTSKNLQLLFMHKEWLPDMGTDFIAATTSWNDFAFGLSINSTNIKNIELRQKPGPAYGTFSSHFASIGLSSSYSLSSSVSFGITAKFLYEKIFVDEASGYGLDFGARYRTPLDIVTAFSINNLGVMNALRTEATKLPTSLRFGCAYQLPLESINSTLILASDVVSYTTENQSHLNLGTEIAYQKYFSVRLGYQTGYESRDFSTGIGIQYGWFQLDYAFLPFGYNISSAHTISLGINFE
ncbi:MAG: PorV/PorQ family protein [Bacteroidota bacterium]|nr:PorV/PorQ family protein [Bacteroidota bacterium]